MENYIVKMLYIEIYKTWTKGDSQLKKGELKIFYGSSGEQFAKRMSRYMRVDTGKTKLFRFTEGNTFVKVDEPIREQDFFLVHPIGLDPNNEFMELVFWIDAAKRASAKSVTVIMPYFSYAKADKKDEPRVSIRGRVCADMLEGVGADRIITMDLHSPQVQGFFTKPVDHLYAMPLLVNKIEQFGLDNLVVVSPDAGFVADARRYANRIGTSLVIGNKFRSGHDENAAIMEVIGDVKGKNCLIVDDFSISGGTLCHLAERLKLEGANRIFAALSHVLLNAEGVKRIENSPIEKLISTDSVYNECVLKSPKIELISVAPLFAEAVLRIVNRESLGDLFDEIPDTVFEQSLILPDRVE